MRITPESLIWMCIRPKLEPILFWKAKPGSYRTENSLHISKRAAIEVRLQGYGGHVYITVRTGTSLWHRHTCNPVRHSTLILLLCWIKKGVAPPCAWNLKSSGVLFGKNFTKVSVCKASHSIWKYCTGNKKIYHSQQFVLEDVGDLWLLVNKDSGENHS